MKRPDVLALAHPNPFYLAEMLISSAVLLDVQICTQNQLPDTPLVHVAAGRPVPLQTCEAEFMGQAYGY